MLCLWKLCSCVCVYVCACVYSHAHPTHMWGAGHSSWESVLSFHLVRIPGIKLRLLYALTLLAGFFLFCFCGSAGDGNQVCADEEVFYLHPSPSLVAKPFVLFFICGFCSVFSIQSHNGVQTGSELSLVAEAVLRSRSLCLYLPLPGLQALCSASAYLEHCVRHWAPARVYLEGHVTTSGVAYGFGAWLPYYIEVWAYNPLSPIHFNKSWASATGQSCLAWAKTSLFTQSFLSLEQAFIYVSSCLRHLGEEAVIDCWSLWRQEVNGGRYLLGFVSWSHALLG